MLLFRISSALLLLCASVSAQIGGSGWTPFTVSFKVQSPTNVPQSARYWFTNNIYHCLVYSNDGAFSPGNTTRPRTEQRFNPDYTSGEIQYQAGLMARSNENSYCVFQIHTGDAQSPTYGSTTFMLFWFTSDGGSVHDYSGTELAGNLGNKWFQLNVDHNLVTRTIMVWVNQKLVWTQQDNGAGDFYFKDGVYEQDHGPTYEMDTYVTNILMWTSSGKNPPAAPTGLSAASTATQIGLAWNPSVNATNYNLKRSTNNGGPYTTITSSANTNYTDTGLLAGTNYYYVVTAVDQFGESANSTQVTASLFNLGYELSALPSAASLLAGNSTNYTVTMATNNTFSGSVKLGIAGLPSGATASFSPSSLSNAGTSTLTVQTTTSTPSGNWVLTVGGTNGASLYTTTVTLAVTGFSGNPGTMVWTSGSGVNTNWSTGLNWTNTSQGGYGPPGISNDVVFENYGSAGAAATTTSVVDFSASVNSLWFANTNGYHTLLIAPGQTLTAQGANTNVSNGSPVMQVGNEQANTPGNPQALYTTVNGAGGALILSNSSQRLQIRQGGSSSSDTIVTNLSTLDLSGLDTFTALLAGINLGIESTSPRHTGGILYLARTNTLTLSQDLSSVKAWFTSGNPSLAIGHNTQSGETAGSGLYLGQANTVYVNYVVVGRGTQTNAPCFLVFNPAFTNNSPSAYFRASDTVSKVAIWAVGDDSAGDGGWGPSSATNDFTGGTVDVAVTNLFIGRGRDGNSAGTTGIGTMTFNSGIINATFTKVGAQIDDLAGDATNSSGIGTLNVNGAGATFFAGNTLELAHTNGGSTASSSGATVGTLNINGGAVQTTNLIGGGGVSTVNLNSGTLDLQYANPSPGRIANISTLNIGAGGVSDAALLANAASITVSNPIVVAANGTLSGNTVITSPGLTINGGLSPGTNGVGWMTNNGPVTFGPGANWALTVRDAAAGAAAGWGYLYVTNGINVQASSGNPLNITVVTPISQAANFSNGTNYDWVVATARQGLTNYAAAEFTVDDSGFVNDLAGGYFFVRTNSANSLLLSFTNNHSPVAALATWYRTNGMLTIPLPLLATNWSDPDGDPVILFSVDTNSVNGVNDLSTDGTNIYYVNASMASDTITYWVQDARTNPPAAYRPGDTARTATGQINVLFEDFLLEASPGAAATLVGGTTNYTLTITPTNGFSGTVTLSVSGVPAGAGYNLSQTNLASGLVTLTVIASNGVALGNYPLTITGACGSLNHDVNVTLSVEDFGLTGTPMIQTLRVGGATNWTVSVNASNGFSGAVALDVSGLPAGVDYSFNPSSVTGGGNSILSLTAGGGVTLGSYPLTLTGASAGQTRTGLLTLLVERQPDHLVWDGTQNGIWDIGQTANWMNVESNSVDVFLPGDTVLFDDTAGVVTNVSLASGVAVQPAALNANISTNQYTISGAGKITGATGLNLSGASLLTLSTTNDYTGNTVISGGTLALSGGGALPGSVNIQIGGGAVLDVSGRYDETLTLGNGQTLSGNGTLNGRLTSIVGSTVSPGDAIGTLTVTNVVTLQGTTFMKLDAGNGTDDVIGGAAMITYGGTLSLTNINGTLTTNNAFQLFSAASYVGSFASLTPAVPGPGMIWYTNSLTNGVLTIAQSDFAMSATPATQVTQAGGSVNYTVTVTPTNVFSGTVTLSVSGLPAGAGYSLNPTNLSGSGSSTLTVTTSNGIVAGNYPLTVTGTSGGLAHSTSVTLSVNDFGVGATPASQTVAAGSGTSYTIGVGSSNGFGGTVTLSVNGLPAGAGYSLIPTNLSGSGNSTLTVTTTSGIVAGNYPLTITGASGSLAHNTSVTLSVNDFGVAATPSSQTVTAASGTGYTVTVGASNGFTGTVALSVSGLPPGAGYSFGPSSISGSGSSTLSITTSNGIVTGNYPLTITGTSGGLVHSASVTLSVNDFGVGVTPSSQTVTVGGATSYTIGVGSSNGFTGTVTLSLSGLPAGAGYSLNPTNLTGAGSSALSLSLSNSVAPASYPLTVTGTSGGLARTADLTLNVVPPSPPWITGITMAGPSVVLAGTNGVPGWSYSVLGTFNVNLPLNQWMAIATNVFDANGNFLVTNPAGATRQYYLIRTP